MALSQTRRVRPSRQSTGDQAMTKAQKTPTSLAVAGLCAALFLGVHTGAAAVECKGMEKAACERSSAQCSWVDPYTRKDGVKVSGHCRKKPGNKSGEAKS
jgi:hypothetical protein